MLNSDAWLSFFTLLLCCLLITSCHCSFSLSSNKHHACKSSSFSVDSWAFSPSSSSTETRSLFPPFLHQAAMCPVLPHVQHVLVSPLPPFSCPFTSFLAAAFLPGVLSSILAAFAALPIPVLTLANAPLSFASSFVYSLQSDVHDPLVSFSARILSIFLRCHSNLHWGTRVMFLVSGCRNCHYLVDNDVLQRNNEFTVRHRRPSEPVVQQASWHQFLDCKHRFLVSDLAKSVLTLVHLVCERPQDVVKLLTLSVILLINAAYAGLLSDVFL